MMHTILLALLAQDPSVLLNGKPELSLDAAVGKATNGSLIELGPGVHPLSPAATLTDVTLIGSGADNTVISSIEPYGAAFLANGDVTVKNVTLTGSVIGVEVESGIASFEHVIFKGHADASVRVMMSEGYASVNLSTFCDNAVAVDVWEGGAMVVNSAFRGNGTALRAYQPVGHEYNVYDNNGADFDGAAASATEVMAPIKFVGPDDYREAAGSATIDAGDPATPAAFEPVPNGQRVNVGAFGNTPQAAPSDVDAASGTPSAAARTAGGGGASGCAMSARATSCHLLLAALAIASLLGLRKA